MTTLKSGLEGKRVVVLQSNYLPWKGYFDLIQSADLLIFYDDTQYTKNDWRNRNRIITPRGIEWISVPCGPKIHRFIHEVKPTNERWQRNHWNKIVEGYHAAPYFKMYKDFFEEFYLAKPWSNLSELNCYLIGQISRQFLGIHTPSKQSTEYSLKGLKEERLVDLLLQAGATHYLSGPTGKSFLRMEPFDKAGIQVEWMDYNGYPTYPQSRLPFVHEVSIIDLLFNTGHLASKYLIREKSPWKGSSSKTISIFS